MGVANWRKRFWQGAAWSAAGAGMAGTVLPLVPTTPLLLLALWCAGRASPEFQRRLEAHPRIGPPVRAWREHRALPARARQIALLLILGSFVTLAFAGLPDALLLAVYALLLGVTVFVITRPDPPGDSRSTIDD